MVFVLGKERCIYNSDGKQGKGPGRSCQKKVLLRVLAESSKSQGTQVGSLRT